MITQHEYGGKQITTISAGTEGVLFDLDDTVTKTSRHLYESWQQFFAKHGGVKLTHKAFYSNYINKTPQQIFKELLGNVSSSEEDRLHKERLNIYKQNFRKTGAEIPGLTPLLISLGEAGIKCSIVTGSSRPTRDFHLDHLNLHKYFSVVVGAEDTEKHKPNPEPYREALGRLSVTASNCIAFEDSPAGVASATSSGIPTIGILSTHTAKELKGVKATIKNYTGVQILGS